MEYVLWLILLVQYWLGSCHITTADPKDDSAIDLAYLSNPADIDVLQKGFQLLEKVVATSPLKEKSKRDMIPSPSM